MGRPDTADRDPPNPGQPVPPGREAPAPFSHANARPAPSCSQGLAQPAARPDSRKLLQLLTAQGVLGERADPAVRDVVVSEAAKHQANQLENGAHERGGNEPDLKRDVRSSPKDQHLCFGKCCGDGAPRRRGSPIPGQLPRSCTVRGTGGLRNGGPSAPAEHWAPGEAPFPAVGEGNSHQRGLLEGSEVEK